MKAVKGKLPEDRVSDFEKGAQAYAKKLIANFKDYEFVGISQPYPSGESQRESQYTGESMDVEGMVALLNYREDGITRTCSPLTKPNHPALRTRIPAAYFTFWKDGLKEVKL
jgi:Translationally controlled tumour protein